MKKRIISLLVFLIFISLGYFCYLKYTEIPEEYLKFNNLGLTFNREEIENKLANNYYYNQLSDDEKLIYEAMYDASLKNRNYFEYTFDIDENINFSRIREAFCNDLPLYYWWNHIYYTERKYTENSFKNRYYYYVTQSAQHDSIDFDNIVSKILEKSNDILETCRNDDDYIYIKNIHDYLIENVVYNELVPNEHAVIGSILNGQSVCDGYAYGFQLLTNLAGYDCVTVIGKTINSLNDESHAWNKIKIDNDWYNVDVTWDDTDGRNESNNISYQYFLSNDDVISIDHTEFTDFKTPQCNDLDLYYKDLPGEVFEEFNKKDIKNFINKWLSKGQKKYDFIFLNHDEYTKAYKWLFDEEGLVEIYRNYYGPYNSFSYGVNFKEEANYIQAYYDKY